MGKALASGFGQFAQAAKIGLVYCRRCLDLHSGNGSGTALNSDVHFRIVPVTEVRERHGCIMPTCLSSQFLDDERFQKLSKRARVVLPH